MQEFEGVGNRLAVDCVAGEWTSWSECKVGQNCTDAYQERTRVILRPQENGGAECPNLRETRKCFSDLCEPRRSNRRNRNKIFS